MQEILALIPARSGSQGVPDKNIRPLMGRPLIAYSIEHALRCPSITRVIVSTDSEVYAKIARAAGAEVPFLRPVEFAQDRSTDLDVFLHTLAWLKENEGYIPDLCVHLRPTCPVRRTEDIEEAIRILHERPDCDSVRTVAPAVKTPFKMWFLREDHCIVPVLQSDVPEAYNLPRQLLPPVHMQIGCIDVVRTSVLLEKRSMTGDRIYGYSVDASVDIDTPEDFQRAAEYLACHEARGTMVRT